MSSISVRLDGCELSGAIDILPSLYKDQTKWRRRKAVRIIGTALYRLRETLLWPLDVMTLPSSLQIDLILLIIPMVNEAVTFDWSLTFVLKYNSTCMDVCKFPFRWVVKLFYLYITHYESNFMGVFIVNILCRSYNLWHSNVQSFWRLITSQYCRSVV